jgi:hypothetical protein
MDPYLEDRSMWRDVHLRLIAAMGDALAPQVAPAYYVAIEQRVYVTALDRSEFIPDAIVIAASPEREQRGGTAVVTAGAVTTQTVMIPRYEEVREGYLEIRDVRGHEVVTAIELLSSTNKLLGAGRNQYEEKRHQLLTSATHLVEIDLLREGEPMATNPLPTADYRIFVSPTWERPNARLSTFGIRQPIPRVSVPLRQTEAEAHLAVGELLAQVYDRARYDLRLDYKAPPPEPALSAEDEAWVDALLREKRLRPSAAD